MSARQSGVLIPQSETARNTLLLGDLIKADYEEQGLDLPTLVFVPRSGLEIAGSMCRHLKIGAASMLVAAAERVAPAGTVSADQEFKIGQFPTDAQVADKHLLVVDIVCRSGNTLSFITERLARLGAASVKSAVIYDMKPLVTNKAAPKFRPDYYLENGYFIGFAIFHWEWEERAAEMELERQREISPDINDIP